MDTVIAINKPNCCKYLLFANNLLVQANNLGLNEVYKSTLSHIILQGINCTDHEQVRDWLIANKQNILTERNTAFISWMEGIRDKYTFPSEEPAVPEGEGL